MNAVVAVVVPYLQSNQTPKPILFGSPCFVCVSVISYMRLIIAIAVAVVPQVVPCRIGRAGEIDKLERGVGENAQRRIGGKVGNGCRKNGQYFFLCVFASVCRNGVERNVKLSVVCGVVHKPMDRLEQVRGEPVIEIPVVVERAGRSVVVDNGSMRITALIGIERESYVHLGENVHGLRGKIFASVFGGGGEGDGIWPRVIIAECIAIGV